MYLWGYQLNTENKFIDYHTSSMNIREFTSSQIYYEIDKKKSDRREFSRGIQLDYKISKENVFETILQNRKSNDIDLQSDVVVNQKLLAQFCQLAFIGNDKKGRMYPSGGEQYNVNVYFLLNEKNVSEEIIQYGNIGYVSCEQEQLFITHFIPWSEIEKAIIQKWLPNRAKLCITLSVDIQSISEKYQDISYKLVLLEAGHIGQNIQLVAEHLGMRSIPLQGYYDIELNRMIGNNQSILYTFLIG